MSNYRRSYLPGGCWFFTVNLQNRHSDLLTRHTDHLRAAIACAKRKRPFQINSWVVLPEHMHCIWTLPEGDSDYSGRWREIKKSFTRALAQSQIWQPRFWEHAIRNDEDYRRHIDYVYINPLKHRLVGRVSDWPYSTFHRDVRQGLYPEDWAGHIAEMDAGERR
ncbi:REP-associated tyrosine transposase [Klebsiella aerogenes]|uniref:REP-associated tyrosine transposase n=1 Tax=Klebsiella aerogenes TaxID=548 RepID=UPI001BD4CE91|nr:transposase [Klebsiella aerogenes]EKV8808947.1 transposase [Klebsiella aerogenes]ELJ2008289.1 transposase [Klebsiella aerogenes]HDS7215082.1 transposase [Klebsiella aerogenes]HDT4317598.1 transposase [Klebsiella aerogenes]HEO9309351.1 transposase [Klebsiella aerogenes]